MIDNMAVDTRKEWKGNTLIMPKIAIASNSKSSAPRAIEMTWQAGVLSMLSWNANKSIK